MTEEPAEEVDSVTAIARIARQVEVNRYAIIGLSLVVGLVLGVAIYVGRKEATHAQEARQSLRKRDRELTGAIKRISALEKPSLAERRKRLEQLISTLDRARARRLIRKILQQATPRQRRELREVMPPGAGGPPRSPPARSRPPGDSPGPSPGSGPSPGGRPSGPSLPPQRPPNPEPPLLPKLPKLPDLPKLPKLPQLLPLPLTVR